MPTSPPSGSENVIARMWRHKPRRHSRRHFPWFPHRQEHYFPPCSVGVSFAQALRGDAIE